MEPQRLLHKIKQKGLSIVLLETIAKNNIITGHSSHAASDRTMNSSN